MISGGVGESMINSLKYEQDPGQNFQPSLAEIKIFKERRTDNRQKLQNI